MNVRATASLALLVVLLNGCSEQTDIVHAADRNKDGQTDGLSANGTFEATLGERAIKVAVTCEVLNNKEVWFYSDQAEYSSAADVDGDRIAVVGQPSQREGLSLALEISLDSKVFTANSGMEGQIPGYVPLQLDLNGQRLMGSGTMLGETFPLPAINFVLSCE